MTMKPSVIVYKIANLDDKENTITINFKLSMAWYDTRIGLETGVTISHTEQGRPQGIVSNFCQKDVTAKRFLSNTK